MSALDAPQVKSTAWCKNYPLKVIAVIAKANDWHEAAAQAQVRYHGVSPFAIRLRRL
jgi:hypothetical protein